MGKRHGDNIAGYEEVIERAQKLLKEQEIYLTKKEMEEVYEITHKYIKHRLDEEPWCTVKLGNLGRAYYDQPYCTTKKVQYKWKKPRSEKDEKRYQLWKQREEAIEEHYQDHKPGTNAKWSYKCLHVVQPFLKKASRRQFKIEDVEEIQNQIE